MRAQLSWHSGHLVDATQDLTDSVRQCDNHYKTWKSWLDLSFNCYQSYNRNPEWARSVFQVVALALRYKPFKNRLLFADVLFILAQQDVKQGAENL